MPAVDVFEAIGEPGRGQRVGPQPAARIGEPTYVYCDETGNGTHPQQRAPPGQRGALQGQALCVRQRIVTGCSAAIAWVHAHAFRRGRPLPYRAVLTDDS